jgi:serine/threonine protein kinase
MPLDLSQPGARIGKYRLLEHIATGGMGSVYRALDEALNRVVALKVLLPQASAKASLLERFKREARHAARLSHPNIVTLYDCGEVEGIFYLAMEFIQGIDLAEYIRRRGQLDPEEARRMTIQAGKALEHAFSQGLTHRDIKPSNLLLTREGDRLRVKLTDMGLARTVDEEQFRVTRDGTTVGTVDYMSPEQARDSAAADVRSDIYSLGCTLYHMLAGRPPFNEGGLGQRIYQHQSVEPTDVREHNPQVPAGLWAVLRRMLAKDPADRYQTPAELQQALKGANRPEAPQPAPPAPAATPTPMPSSPRSKRDTSVPDAPVTPPSSAVVGLSPEQVKAAAGQFERASEILRESGPTEYAQELLLSCCKLDPSNAAYRKTLREVGRALGGGKRGWLGSLSLGGLANRGKFKSAKRAGDHRKVLDLGEEVLGRNPKDIATQVDMAESAEALGWVDLAVWLLEQACEQDPSAVGALRALARLYERLGSFSRAITAWEQVRKANPTDIDAPRKINALAAKDTIARGGFKRKRR